MPKAYAKPLLIAKMMRHIENPGLIRAGYSGIFRYIQGHSALFSHFQAY